jgi:hypothetical protein
MEQCRKKFTLLCLKIQFLKEKVQVQNNDVRIAWEEPLYFVASLHVFGFHSDSAQTAEGLAEIFCHIHLLIERSSDRK